MKEEIKIKWLRALRSGEYKQTKVRLHNLEGYSCLGVLCDLYIKDSKGEARWMKYRKHYKIRDKDRILSKDLLTFDVVDWAGIDTAGGFKDTNGEWDTLAFYNYRGKTFLEIADIIEQLDIKNCRSKS